MTAMYPTSSASNMGELSRLLTAAVVNRNFCNMLLTNPANALDKGYNGESFRLAKEEKALILSINAKSLTEFAMKLTGSHNSSGRRESGCDPRKRPFV
jgi:hypothetical protein